MNEKILSIEALTGNTRASPTLQIASEDFLFPTMRMALESARDVLMNCSNTSDASNDITDDDITGDGNDITGDDDKLHYANYINNSANNIVKNYVHYKLILLIKVHHIYIKFLIKIYCIKTHSISRITNNMNQKIR